MAAMSKNDIATKVGLDLPPEATPERGNTPGGRLANDERRRQTANHKT